MDAVTRPRDLACDQGEARLLIVIPTRNRSDLAAEAISSVLNNVPPEVSVWVSDNSSQEEHIHALETFCSQELNRRVRYLRPQEPLPIGPHWSWISGLAAQAESITHVVFLSDRFAFKPRGLEILVRICASHPDRIVVYDNDLIDDAQQPVQLTQIPWTGRLLDIDSKELFEFVHLHGWAQPLPRLLNCAVPVVVLNLIRARFGDICLATVPDIAFGFRAIAACPSILFLDLPLMTDRARDRSTGNSLVKGFPSESGREFLQSIAPDRQRFGSVHQGGSTLCAWVFHAYDEVRTKVPGWPSVNPFSLRRLMLQDLRRIQNPEFMQKIQTDIRAISITQADVLADRIARRKRKIRLHWLLSRLSSRLDAWLNPKPRLRTRFLRWIGLPPWSVRKEVSYYDSVSLALSHAVERPLPRKLGWSRTEQFMKARCIDSSAGKVWGVCE